MCKNADKRCIFCVDYSQFREKKTYSTLKSKPKSNGKGLDFEEVVFDKYKDKVLGRTPGSGMFDNFKGDIQLIKSMFECKSTYIKKGGKKQITIKKKAHDKIKKEAEKSDMLPFLIYGFKEPDGIDEKNIYFSTDYNYLLELLSELKRLNEKLDRKDEVIKKLKEEIETLKNNTGGE